MAPEVVCIASWNVDLIAQIPSPLLRGQTQLASQLQRLPGGKGSNAAVAAARAEKQDKQEKLVDTDFEKPDETDLNDIPSDKVRASQAGTCSAPRARSTAPR